MKFKAHQDDEKDEMLSETNEKDDDLDLPEIIGFLDTNDQFHSLSQNTNMLPKHNLQDCNMIFEETADPLLTYIKYLEVLYNVPTYYLPLQLNIDGVNMTQQGDGGKYN